MFWGASHVCPDGLPWLCQRIRHEGEPIRRHCGYGQQHRQQPIFQPNDQQWQLPRAHGPKFDKT